MSTKGSLYYWNRTDVHGVERTIHVYTEMHDDAIHCYLARANAELNIILSRVIWEEVLQPRLRVDDLDPAEGDLPA